MPKIKLKRGWKANLPQLDEGEPGFTTDTKEVFIGSSTGNIQLAKKEDVNGLPDRVGTLETQMTDKADQTYVDTELQSVNSSLAEITSVTLNAKSFGVKGDGVQDDITFLETAISQLPLGATLNLPPKSTIKISRPWVIKKGNLKIKGNGCKIIYTGTQSLGSNNGINRYYGAITLEGSLDESKKLTIASIMPNYYDSVVKRTMPMAKIATGATDATTTFAVGDIVFISAQNYVSLWAQNYADNPALVQSPAKIVSISGGDIFVDINPDFVFGGADFNGTITKMNNLDNITIEDIFYEDGNNTAVPSSPTNAERESWVGGIHAYCCSNLTINNFESIKHRFPAIMTFRVYNYSIENGRFYYPRAISAGCGYGIQNNFSVHGNFQKLRGIDLRHLCDFSGGGHHYVEDATQPDYNYPVFGCHGIGEFDITFNRVTGMLAIGNGISSFPEMTTGIKLNDFHGSILSNWVNDLKITNSEVYFMEEHAILRVVNFSISNSKINGLKADAKFYASSRGDVYLDSMFVVDKCELEIKNIVSFASGAPLQLLGYENVKFVDNPKLQNKYATGTEIWLANCRYIHFVNNTVKDLGVNIMNSNLGVTEPINNITTDDGFIFWSGNVLLTTWTGASNPSFLNINSPVTKFKISISDNLYDAVVSSRWIRFNSGVTGTIFLTATGNTFSKNIVEAISGGSPIVEQSNNNLEGYSGGLLKPSPKYGTLTFNGDSTTVVQTIPHGLGKLPTFFQVTPSSVDAGTADIKFVTADATNLTVTFKAAPVTGVNNVKLTWKAEA